MTKNGAGGIIIYRSARPIEQIGNRRQIIGKEYAGLPAALPMKSHFLCLVVLLSALVFLLPCCSGENTTDTGMGESDALSVSLDSLSDEPLFVDWEQDGQPMQLIALKDEDGVRVAYNTCQSCAGSPYAYYEYENGILTCLNCGFTFSLDAVGAISGGCNPKPVGEYAIEDDVLIIRADELKSAASDFKTWKEF